MSAASTYKPQSSVKYRTAEYYDGNTVRIQESRRRAPAFSPTGQVTSRRRQQPIHKRDSVMTTKFCISDVQIIDSPPDAVESGRLGGPHVTSTMSSLRASAKPVVFQASSSTSFGDKVVVVSPPALAMPTPPPTPKIDRLPTPELPELENLPFCDCCMKAHVIKYCASCGADLKMH